MRAPIVSAALVLAAIVPVGCGGDEPDASPPAPGGAPNVLSIVIDDANFAQVTPETMPALHEFMAERGTTFTDYIVTSPLCCPARATLITGQYGHNNGVLSNNYPKLRDKDNVLPVWMQQNGYVTAHVGKYLNGYEKTLEDRAEVPPGWDEWFTALEPQRYYDYALSNNGRVERYGNEDEDYLTRVLTRHTLDLIGDFASGDRPFFIAWDPYNVHFGPGRPGRCLRKPTPDPMDEDLFGDARSPRNPAVWEADRSDKPAFIQELPGRNPARVKQLDAAWGCTLAALTSTDRAISELLDALDETGELDNTLVLFSSDNGVFYGEHGIPEEKQFPYLEAYRMPLAVALPANMETDAPETLATPVASIDLAPTILDLTDGEPCPDQGKCREPDGSSLAPFLAGEMAEGAWDDRARGVELALPGNKEVYPRTCEYYGIRVRDIAYVRHVTVSRPGEECKPTRATELYDLAEDPFQLESLAGEAPRLERRTAKLAKRVSECAGSGPDNPGVDFVNACP